jgi:hypothetical protein
MYSALFGLFWNYFSTKRNLAFQALRVGWNISGAVRGIPKISAYVKGQSLMGLTFLDWVNSIYPTNETNVGYEFLEITAQGNPSPFFWMFFIIYAVLISLTTPYLFYRFFRWKGIFKRLPNF